MTRTLQNGWRRDRLKDVASATGSSGVLEVDGKLLKPETPSSESKKPYAASDKSEFHSLPQGWMRCRIKDVISINNGSDPKSDGDVPVYGSGGRSFRTCGEFKEGPTVLLGRKGTIDIPFYVTGRYWNVDTAFDAKSLFGKADLRFFYYLACTFDFKKYHTQTTVPSMTQTDYRDMHVAFPPLPEQKRIAAFLDAKCADIDKAIAAKRKQLDSIETIWSNVLHTATLHGIDGAKLKPANNAIVKKIPVGWKFKKLRYIGRCQNGISKAGQYFGYGYPFLPYGDVYNNIALPEVASGLIDSTPEERKCYSVERGDIFFTRTSETADEVGFSSVCLKTIPDATFAGFVIRVRPVTDDLLPEFSQYYFRNPFVSQHFAKEMMVVTRASLSQGILKSLPVLIPPRDEQKRIAEYLDAKRRNLDELKDNLRRQIEVLEQYRKSLIHECVTGKRRIEE